MNPPIIYSLLNHICSSNNAQIPGIKSVIVRNKFSYTRAAYFVRFYVPVSLRMGGQLTRTHIICDARPR